MQTPSLKAPNGWRRSQYALSPVAGQTGPISGAAGGSGEHYSLNTNSLSWVVFASHMLTSLRSAQDRLDGVNKSQDLPSVNYSLSLTHTHSYTHTHTHTQSHTHTFSHTHTHSQSQIHTFTTLTHTYTFTHTHTHTRTHTHLWSPSRHISWVSWEATTEHTVRALSSQNPSLFLEAISRVFIRVSCLP